MQREKFDFLLGYVESRIDEEIEAVLNDSETDPHRSAVYTAGLIRVYMEFAAELHEKPLPYKTVEEYFAFNAYTDEEYALFEKKRQIESAYYIGKQF